MEKVEKVSEEWGIYQAWRKKWDKEKTKNREETIIATSDNLDELRKKAKSTRMQAGKSIYDFFSPFRKKTK